MADTPRPAGHQTITPACIVTDAKRAIQFMQDAFRGEVVERYEVPSGEVVHAEVLIGDCVVMLGEAMGDMPELPAALSYYVPDGPAVDATFTKALEAGARSLKEPEDQFYGYRTATVKDPCGNRWTICGFVEEVSDEEAHRRMEAMMKG